MHIPVAEPDAMHSRPPIKSQHKHTQYDSMRRLPTENNDWLSVFVERTYISSRVQLNAQTMKEIFYS